MPRFTQDSLTHVLLFWLTLLSVIQAAFIIFFFTSGHHGPSSIPQRQESTLQPQNHNLTLLPPHNHTLIKGQMFTYKAFQENGKIRWTSRYETNGIISENDKGLMIQEDGYYFLNLQVTLKTCPCNETKGSESVVKLRGMGPTDRDLLLGWINAQTCSTGLLGKVEVLSQGTTLETAKTLDHDIDESETLTHLDIIMLQPSDML